MSKYKIEEVRETLVNGEVNSVFYIYKPFLFFWRKYDTNYVEYEEVREGFDNLESALVRIKEAEEQDGVNSVKKVKKTEIIIHKL